MRLRSVSWPAGELKRGHGSLPCPQHFQYFFPLFIIFKRFILGPTVQPRPPQYILIFSMPVMSINILSSPAVPGLSFF